MPKYTVGWAMHGTVEVVADTASEALDYAPDEIGAFVDFDGRTLEIVDEQEEE